MMRIVALIQKSVYFFCFLVFSYKKCPQKLSTKSVHKTVLKNCSQKVAVAVAGGDSEKRKGSGMGGEGEPPEVKNRERKQRAARDWLTS